MDQESTGGQLGHAAGDGRGGVSTPAVDPQEPGLERDGVQGESGVKLQYTFWIITKGWWRGGSEANTFAHKKIQLYDRETALVINRIRFQGKGEDLGWNPGRWYNGGSDLHVLEVPHEYL